MRVDLYASRLRIPFRFKDKTLRQEIVLSVFMVKEPFSASAALKAANDNPTIRLVDPK
jgi:hypothetical protein